MMISKGPGISKNRCFLKLPHPFEESTEGGVAVRGSYWTSKRYAGAFIGPALVVLVLIVIVPTIFLWYISFTDYQLTKPWGTQAFVGLDNFFRLLSGRDHDFWPSVRISLVFLVVSVTVEFVAGFAIAGLFNRPVWGKRVWMSFLILPMTITPAVIGLMWKLMYNTEYGVLNFLLNQLGLANVNWLGVDAALWSVILVDVWQWTPFVALILYAGLQALPTDPFESSVIDGASAIQIFRYITLPLMKPMVSIALFLRTIDALKIFDTVYVLTRGGPGNATELLSLQVYRVGFQHTGWIGRSSAIAIIYLILSSIIILNFARLMRFETDNGAKKT